MYTIIVYSYKHVSIVSICCVHSYGIHLVMCCITCVLLQDGDSALSIALWEGNEELAGALITAGADIKITDNVRNVHSW